VEEPADLEAEVAVKQMILMTVKVHKKYLT